MADESARLAELLTVPRNFNLQAPGVPLLSRRPLLITHGNSHNWDGSWRDTFVTFTYKPKSCLPPAEDFFFHREIGTSARPLVPPSSVFSKSSKYVLQNGLKP